MPNRGLGAVVLRVVRIAGPLSFTEIHALMEPGEREKWSIRAVQQSCSWLRRRRKIRVVEGRKGGRKTPPRYVTTGRRARVVSDREARFRKDITAAHSLPSTPAAPDAFSFVELGARPTSPSEKSEIAAGFIRLTARLLGYSVEMLAVRLLRGEKL